MNQHDRSAQCKRIGHSLILGAPIRKVGGIDGQHHAGVAGYPKLRDTALAQLHDPLRHLQLHAAAAVVLLVKAPRKSQEINSFITQGVDLIICNLVQTSSADTIVNKVVDAGIPLVLINREPLAYDADGKPLDEAYEGILNNPGVCYVGADARQSGTYQGEIVAALPDKGDANGDGVVSYVMIEGDPENIDAQYRTEFSIKALEDAGITVECLDDQVGNWATDKGQQIAANALSAHGDKIDVIFCNNDGMALGAAAAITAAGRTVGEDIYLLGVDALEECQEMVKNGTMTGTVLNDHVGQSHKAVDVAVQALNGEAIDNYYWVDYVKVDASYFG